MKEGQDLERESQIIEKLCQCDIDSFADQLWVTLILSYSHLKITNITVSLSVRRRETINKKTDDVTGQ